MLLQHIHLISIYPELFFTLDTQLLTIYTKIYVILIYSYTIRQLEGRINFMPIVLLFIMLSYYRLQSHMLTFRFQPKAYLPAYTGFYILFCLQSYSSDWFPNLPLKFVFILLSNLYLFFLYTDNYRTRIFWIVLPYIIESLCDLVSMLILTTCTRISIRNLIANPTFETIGNLLTAI